MNEMVDSSCVFIVENLHSVLHDGFFPFLFAFISVTSAFHNVEHIYSTVILLRTCQHLILAGNPNSGQYITFEVGT